MKLNILLCDIFEGLLPDYIPSYVSMFENLFNAQYSTIEYEIHNVWQNEFPAKAENGQAYLITGSNAGVYENKPWIKQLMSFITDAYTNRAKLAGICFGHQAIAQALGGKVEKAAVGWGTGIRTSLIVNNAALNYFHDGTMRLLYNHHDQVTELPPAATLFATSEFCPNEGFYIGNHVLTFQGHPEYSVEYAKHLIMNHAADEPSFVKEQALASMQTPTLSHTKAAKWMLEFFD